MAFNAFVTTGDGEYFIQVPDRIYFIENRNGEWLTEDHSFTIDPHKAMKFDSDGYVITYMVVHGIKDCIYTEHEFVDPPAGS